MKVVVETPYSDAYFDRYKTPDLLLWGLRKFLSSQVNVVKKILPTLPKHALVVDIGCGSGGFLELLRLTRADFISHATMKYLGSFYKNSTHVRPYCGAELAGFVETQGLTAVALGRRRSIFAAFMALFVWPLTRDVGLFCAYFLGMNEYVLAINPSMGESS